MALGKERIWDQVGRREKTAGVCAVSLFFLHCLSPGDFQLPPSHSASHLQGWATTSLGIFLDPAFPAKDLGLQLP